MRTAMANAAVGDDVYEEDPTVTQLEKYVATLAKKEAALFVTSGTMGNQIAIRLHTQPGDEVVIGEGAHCAWYETGAAAALSGVQCVVAGAGGLFGQEEFERAIKPRADWYPRTSLVCVENTHNRAGGRVFPFDQLKAVAQTAHRKGLRIHMDGARLWNAVAATGIAIDQWLSHVDTASLCLSKGLGAPVGSVIVGTREHIARARRFRKMLGGGMRQVGILAAGGLYALEHHRERLVDDHKNARNIAEKIAKVGHAVIDLSTVETNIVQVETPRIDAERIVRTAAERGVLIGATASHKVRIVLHLDVSVEQATRAGDVLADVIEQLGASA